ncbi:MAG: WD40 repeat domain-containing protein [Gemmatales bacterium]|nr:WD40 repeat domain-containing protein [Gemmatales bacterium]
MRHYWLVTTSATIFGAAMALCWVRGQVPAEKPSSAPPATGKSQTLIPQLARDLAKRARQVLDNYCHSCHGQDGSAEGGFNYATDLQRLVQRRKVVPGKPDESPLFRRMASGKMPPPDVARRPTQQEIVLLREWIEAGAPLSEAPPDRAFVGDGDVFQAILNDLEKHPPRSRRFLRYFTLHTLYNAGLSDDELQTYRLAVSKLINSLSWHPEITRPQPIDERGLVLRIDMRDFFWDATLWNRLLAEYPYAVQWDSLAARLVAVQTASRLPVVRADWFLATASRAPLYYDLLQLPTTAQELERQLRIDTLLNIQQERVARAGFNNSGVARNNRLIERHYAAHGAYWRTYDFEDIPASFVERTGLIPDRRNLFAYPLGPGNLENNFLHAGGEIIFNLPNGLLGFMLVNARNERINKGPINLVSDPKRPDRAVECAVSCFNCHYTGILPKSDQIRAFVEQNQRHFQRQDVELVRALYVPEPVMRQLMEKDMARFRQAVEKTGGRITASDPIMLATLRYEAYQDLATVAAEVGLPKDAFKQQLAELAARAPNDPDAEAISRNFGALLLPDGDVSRAVIVQAFGDLLRKMRGLAPLNTRNIVNTLPDNSGELDPLQELAATVHQIALDHRNRRFALLAGADKTLRLFDIEQFRETRRLIGHTSSVWSAAISPDSRWAASGSADGTILIWNLRDFVLEKQLRGHTGLIAALAWSTDGSKLYSAAWDGTLIVWDISQGKEQARWSIGGYPAALALMEKCQEIAVALGSECHILGLEDGRVRRILRGHRAPLTALAVSPDNRWLATASDDATVAIWPHASDKPLATLPKNATSHSPAWRSLAWAPNGALLAAADSQGRLIVWQWNGNESKAVGSWQPHSTSIIGLAWLQPPTVGTDAPSTIITWNRDGQAKLTRLPHSSSR